MGDTYLEGIKALQREIRRKPAELGRFVLHFPLYEDQDNNPSDFEEEEDENLLSSSLIESDHNSHDQSTSEENRETEDAGEDESETSHLSVSD
ncbi:hypothetical protein PSHT_06476 [Puccinia striiformis]|uniref:Uncharacterized protein n=1 Tax=Puccinia striiformis TaxID=27350 RepID=A0A2S4W5X5_9BASI|nr:hypothetical protein PSHT_06476 [Puccinia striiformis]